MDGRRRDLGFGIVAGLLAPAAGLAAGHLVASRLEPRSSPVVAVSSAVIQHVPAAVKDWAIATFGTADKPVLVATVLVVTLLVAAAGGIAARRSWAAGVAVQIALGLVAALLAVTLPQAGPVGVVPSLVAIAVDVAVLWWLIRRPGPRLNLTAPRERVAAGGGDSRESQPPAARPGLRSAPGPAPVIDRRTFVTRSGMVVGGSVVAVAVGEAITPIPAVPLEAASTTAPALPRGLEQEAAGIAALQTPVEQFYRIDTALTIPRIDPTSWSLTIDGDVEAPYTLTFDQLRGMPQSEHDITLTCVSNEVGGDLVGGARWQGVDAAELVRRARPRAGADMVLSTSTDGFTASTPLPAMLDGRTALVALGMNGAPLTPTHGAPARLVTAGLYGFVGATKWLSRLTVTSFAKDQAYWTTHGWSDHGPVKTASRIDTPRSGDHPAAGPVTVGGVAWATHRDLQGVEYRVDDGPWQPATLGPEVNHDYWRQWIAHPTLAAGSHTLTVRAIDESGPQTAQEAYVVPDGATGHHTVTFTVG